MDFFDFISGMITYGGVGGLIVGLVMESRHKNQVKHIEQGYWREMRTSDQTIISQTTKIANLDEQIEKLSAQIRAQQNELDANAHMHSQLVDAEREIVEWSRTVDDISMLWDSRETLLQSMAERLSMFDQQLATVTEHDLPIDVAEVINAVRRESAEMIESVDEAMDDTSRWTTGRQPPVPPTEEQPDSQSYWEGFAPARDASELTLQRGPSTPYASPHLRQPPKPPKPSNKAPEPGKPPLPPKV